MAPIEPIDDRLFSTVDALDQSDIVTMGGSTWMKMMEFGPNGQILWSYAQVD